MAQSDMASKFGARQDVQQISISPDGKLVAIVSPTTSQAQELMVVDPSVGGRPRKILRTSGNPDRLRRCEWASETRLVCHIYMLVNDGIDKIGFTRLIALNSDGSEIKLLSARTTDRSMGIMQHGGSLIDWGSGKGALLTREYVPENTTGSHVADSRAGLGVELIDTLSLDRREIERPRQDAVDYISDGRGVVRIMGSQPRTSGGYAGTRINYVYRKRDSRDWSALSTLELGGGSTRGFNPSQVDPLLDVVYGFDALDGRRALYSMALDGSGKRELVLSNPAVDIDHLVTIGRQQRVVGASFVTDKREVKFFDPVLAKLQGALSRALPDRPLISFVDASADENKLLLFAGGDTEPGSYYVFDKQTRGLREVLPVRPHLAGIKLSRVEPVTYPAADGVKVPGYLTLPPGATSAKGLPGIVLPHGGPGARDEWGFDWLSQYFAARGYAVLQPNFRGSSGYGDAWFQKNGFQSWRTAIGDVNDGGKWLIGQGVDPAKLAVVGWSYGGYAALQSAALDAALFKAVVAIAPVTDLDDLRAEARGFMNFPLVDRFIGTGPHLREGSPARNAGLIKAPVLLFHGTMDANVWVNQSRLMKKRLEEAGGKVDYVEFKGLDHQLDDSVARTTMLSRADDFLRTSLQLPAQ